MEKPHKRLEVWKQSMQLVVQVYEITKHFPLEERFCLVTQMRRAAVSIPSNIAKGAARQTKREFTNFLHIAQGSLSELDTQLEISHSLGYGKQELIGPLQKLLENVSKLLTGLINPLIITLDPIDLLPFIAHSLLLTVYYLHYVKGCTYYRYHWTRRFVSCRATVI